MSKGFVRACCLLFIVAGAGAEEPATTTSTGVPELRRFSLENGLRIWHLERSESASVMIAAAVQVGSRYETEENSGISHFLEHMLFAQTQKYPEGEPMEIIERNGGISNGQTLEEK